MKVKGPSRLAVRAIRGYWGNGARIGLKGELLTKLTVGVGIASLVDRYI